jgi:hypothetical protein
MGILVCLQSLSSRPNHSTIDSERRTLYPRGLVIDRKAGSISVIESPSVRPKCVPFSPVFYVYHPVYLDEYAPHKDIESLLVQNECFYRLF